MQAALFGAPLKKICQALYFALDSFDVKREHNEKIVDKLN